jgi:hypothetical protein
MRRSLSIAVLALCVVTMLFAKGTGGTPATATFIPPSAGITGVFSDNGGAYANGVSGVKSYFGSAGKDYELVTYSTSRYLTITFGDADSAAWSTNGKLPKSNSYQVAFNGVNFYGPYSTMGAGTTAQVHGVLQFHYLSNTYQLDYQALEVKRDAVTGVYHFSSIKSEYSPVPTSSQAMLSLVRSRGNVNYGTVILPISFDVQ